MSEARVLITTAPLLRNVSQNGLTTVFQNTTDTHGRESLIISGDLEPGTLNGVTIIPAGIVFNSTNIRQRWHNLGYWQLLHEKAFTNSALPVEGVQALWGSATHPFGSAEHLRWFIDEHVPSLDSECSSLKQFSRAISQIPYDATVSLQDFSCGQMLRVFRDEFKKRGCFVELFHHTGWDEHMKDSKTGRELTDAYAMADAILVHTAKMEAALAADVGSPEKVRTFSLGIDRTRLQRSANTIFVHNVASHIPNYENLTAEQHELILEVFKTEHTVPHRFISIDRIDAVKGNLVVYDAVRKFLECRLKQGTSLDQLREQYRMFFLYTARASQLVGDYTLWSNYSRYAEQVLARLVSDFPGIVFSSYGLEGPASFAIGAMLRNQTILSGGAHDGLNLACMESAFVNRGNAQSIILGRGAGFAEIVHDGGGEGLGFFPAPRSALEFAASMEEVCLLRSTNPTQLAERNSALVDQFVIPRGEATI